MVPEVLGISHGFHGFKYGSQPLKGDFVSACGVGWGRKSGRKRWLQAAERTLGSALGDVHAGIQSQQNSVSVRKELCLGTGRGTRPERSSAACYLCRPKAEHSRPIQVCSQNTTLLHLRHLLQFSSWFVWKSPLSCSGFSKFVKNT